MPCFWSRGCNTISLPTEEVGPTDVFDAASDGEQSVGARFRPAAEPSVDRESAAEPLRQRAPLAAVLQDLQNHIDEIDVRNPHVPALNREKRVDFRTLLCCGLFHDCKPFDFYVIFDSHLSTDPSEIRTKF